MIIVYFILTALFIYLALSVLYFHFFSWGALFPLRDRKVAEKLSRKYAVLIPGYKEDAVIVSVAEAALRQDASREMFDVVVIADSFQPETLERLRELPVKVVEVSFDVSTKSKALNKPMAELGDDCDVAVVLDTDNIMAEDFLLRMEPHFDRGFQVVQGHRVAKNTGTPMAQLDAISEEVNNSVFRKGHRVFGLSSVLIGSGMAFDYAFFKEIIGRIKVIGGFDKELELEMLRDRIQISYAIDAYVYDEKVSRAKSFQNQHRRWLSAQFIYFRRYFGSAVLHLFTKGNLDFFDKAIQMALVPRALLIGFVGLFGVLAYFFEIPPGSEWWIWLPGILVISFLFSIPGEFYNAKTLRALIYLPVGILNVLLSLLKIRGANKKFIHTPHGEDSSSS